jgi:LytR cell envelope-related transcriptional attenuator
VSDTAERRPPGARRRRPLPALVLLLVLVLAALFVWSNVLSDEHARDKAQAAACASASAAPASLDPTTVTLRVFNATDQAGRAAEVATTLQSRGFVVEEIANDSSDAEVTGVGELRYGPTGKAAADYVRLFLPGATDRTDTRATDVVDVVLGPDFGGLATEDQVAAALAPAASAQNAC